jgi:outer membrane receptor protein involved in Fe transport
VNAAGMPVTNSFDGRSRTWVADAIYKWAPGGNATRTNLKLQGEWLHRAETGTLTYDTLGGAGGEPGSYGSSQSGWYLQGVYQFMPTWRVGVRYDRLDPGTIDDGANGAFFASTSFRPERYTAMVDWSPSEFSRLRVQFAQSKTMPDLTDNQFFVQYILSLGAHGAHKY